MLKHTKLITLATIGFFISASAAQACNSVASSFHWPTGWEKAVTQMPVKSAKAQYNLSDKVRTFKIKRMKINKK